MMLHSLNDDGGHSIDGKTNKYIISILKCGPMGKLINRIQGSHLDIKINCIGLLNHSASLAIQQPLSKSYLINLTLI